MTIELQNSNINYENENNNKSKSITLRTITDRQKVVIETISMRLSTKESLLYLHEILTQIANLQPFLSAYYDSIRYVIKCRDGDFSNSDYTTKDMSVVL